MDEVGKFTSARTDRGAAGLGGPAEPTRPRRGVQTQGLRSGHVERRPSYHAGEPQGPQPRSAQPSPGPGPHKRSGCTLRGQPRVPGRLGRGPELSGKWGPTGMGNCVSGHLGRTCRTQPLPPRPRATGLVTCWGPAEPKESGERRPAPKQGRASKAMPPPGPALPGRRLRSGTRRGPGSLRAGNEGPRGCDPVALTDFVSVPHPRQGVEQLGRQQRRDALQHHHARGRCAGRGLVRGVVGQPERRGVGGATGGARPGLRKDCVARRRLRWEFPSRFPTRPSGARLLMMPGFLFAESKNEQSR